MDDIDKPVDKCVLCGADIWKSMITGKLLKSCNCIKPKEKKDVKGKAT